MSKKENNNNEDLTPQNTDNSEQTETNDDVNNTNNQSIKEVNTTVQHQPKFMKRKGQQGQ